MRFVCAYCGKEFEAKRSARAHGNAYCRKAHYHAHQKATALDRFGENARRRDYHNYRRALWGGSGKKAGEVGPWAGPYGREFEKIAVEEILPGEGFSEIDNFSALSNVFFVDIVATRQDGRRVLVDVTTKWSAYIPKKVRLADSLRMPLYILHVSPADPSVYYLSFIPEGRRVSKVPMGFFHELNERKAS